jgi:hypothetical protein
MDFAVTGFVTNTGRISSIYKNNGDGTFSRLSDTLLSGTNFGGPDWLDFDNDGDLDLFIHGRTDDQIEYIARLYRNDGNDQFLPYFDFESLDYSAFDWGDYNNDGFSDIILTGSKYKGFATWEPVTYLYQNDGKGSFFIADSSFVQFSSGSCRFADYDNDGDLDLLLTGAATGYGVYSTIYRNDDGSFTNIEPGLTGLTTSKSAWADVDGDNDFDFVIGGSEGSISLTKAEIYDNDNNGNFTPAPLTGDPLPQVSKPSLEWADFDNDGDPDLLITGQIGLTAERNSVIYRNDGNYSFTLIDGLFTPVRNGAAGWADYDGDGDLDVLLCGVAPNNDKLLRIYRNEGTALNSRPQAPFILDAEPEDGTVMLTWGDGWDPETAEASLTYNLRVGTVPGGDDIFNAHTTGNGVRKLIRTGNTNMSTSWQLNGLDYGAYYWSVQTIDGSFMGSEFSEESMFFIGDPTGLNERLQNNNIELGTNFPNPARDHTNIPLFIPVLNMKGAITLTISDLSGKTIRKISLPDMQKGEQLIRINTSDLNPGVYFYTLRIGGALHVSKRMVVY